MSSKLLGNSVRIEHVRERIRIVAGTAAPVLVSGEKGTGKTLAAEEIHRLSARPDTVLERIDCAVMPESLFETKLFGDNEVDGALTRAAGGTLVLENVEHSPRIVQERLIEVLKREHDVRLIATTATVLADEVKQGRFREDLHYRLGVVEVVMPPLRERRDDIPLITDHFIATLSRAHDKEPITLSDSAVHKLTSGHWRSNLRGLRSAIERAVVLRGGHTVHADDFPLDSSHERRMSEVEEAFRFGSIRDMEKLMILARLDDTGQNRTRAAHTLDISVRTLRNKLHEYNVMRPRKPSRAAEPVGA